MYRSLQAARGYAALAIVLFHLGLALSLETTFKAKYFEQIFKFGDVGVEFFFVLSGFIIMNAHQRDLNDPQKFYQFIKKRLIRIYPLYLVIFAISVAMTAFSDVLRENFPKDLIVIIKTILLMPQDKNVVGGTGAPVVPVAWSLQYEMTFYFIFSLLILLKPIIFFIIIIFILHVLVINESFMIDFVFSNYGALFLFGIIVAKFKSSINNNYRHYLYVGGIILMTISLIKIFNLSILNEGRIILAGVGSALVIMGLVKAEEKGKIFMNHKINLLLGDASYSLYLIHAILIGILCKLLVLINLNKLQIFGSILAFIIISFFCITLSIAFHVAIEKRIIKYLKNKYNA